MRISDWSSDGCSSDLLRQEGEEENRQLRIEEIDQHGGDRHLRRRAALDPCLHPQAAALAQHRPGHVQEIGDRSEESRVGKERVSTWRARRSPCKSQKKTTQNKNKTTQHRTIKK